MPRCLADIQDDIAYLRRQIRKAEAGTSRSGGGRSVSQALGEMYRRLKELETEEAVASRRGGPIQYVPTRRRW